MQKSYFEKTALVAAGAGMLLMVLSLVLRVNPVEGGVVSPLLTGNLPGKILHVVLLVTCMPVWILVVSLMSFLPFSEGFVRPLSCITMVISQGILYFMLVKAGVVCLRPGKRNTGCV
jgi:hypothetical protein